MNCEWMKVVPLALALAGSASAGAAVPQGGNPHGIDGVEGVATDQPAMNPKTGRIAYALVVHERLPVYRSPLDAEPMALPDDARPMYRELLYVMKTDDQVRTRNLIARFRLDDRGRRQFVAFIGWVNPEGLLEASDEALTTGVAWWELERSIPAGDPRLKQLRSWLPFANDPRYRNVPLKSITDPERGVRASFAPPSPDADPAIGGMALEPYFFYYVLKLVVQDKDHVSCLLGRLPKMRLSDSTDPEVYRDNVLGWLEIDAQVFWSTLEGFEFNLDPAAVAARKQAGMPIQFWSSELAAKAAAAAAGQTAAGGLGGALALAPIWIETDDDPIIKVGPWPPHWMRMPIIDYYDLPGPPVVGRDGRPRPRRAYRLAILAGRGGSVVKLSTRADMEAYPAEIRQMIKNAFIYQIVLVIDATGSMEPVADGLRRAVARWVEEIREREKLNPELEQLDIRIGLVWYRDFARNGSAAAVVEDGGKFFHIMKPEGLKELQETLGKIRCSRNGDELEEPFEGIRRAVERYLRPGPGSLATPAASSAILVFGNSGNHAHAPDDPDSQLTLDSTRESLAPRVYDGVRLEKGARVQLHSIFCPMVEGYREPEWDRQFKVLTEDSGGSTHLVEMFAGVDKVPRQLHDVLARGFQEARDQLRRELEALKGQSISKGQGTGPLTSPLHTQLFFDRLHEVVPDEKRYQEIVANLSSKYFAYVHATDQVPEDSGQHRLKLSLLLRAEEISAVASSCSHIASLYQDLLDNEKEMRAATPTPGAAGKPEDLGAETYKKLLVRALAAVLGKIKDPIEIERLERLPLSEIQERVSKLPVPFGCLSGDPPRDDGEARTLIKTLHQASQRLEGIRQRQPHRLFEVGHGSLLNQHAYVYEEELP